MTNEQGKTSGSDTLQQQVDRTIKTILAEYAERKLAADQLAVTVTDWSNPTKPVTAGYRQEVPFYPASVVKMFYLAAVHQWMEDGRATDTPELRRAMHDMIVHSWNEPTGYVVDVLTGTLSGPDLPPAEIAAWGAQREVVNQYFAGLGYTGVNANKKTWDEGPYGRDMQFLAELKSPRNFLTTAATARLLGDIAQGRFVSPERCEQMMALMKRDYTLPDNPDRQAVEYTGPALPAGAKLWSKAGWMSVARHDAAYVELANGAKFVLVIFTAGQSDKKELITTVARGIVAGFV